ncbi:MAG: hypothetical protein EXS35_05720 [Pedosphaera sp.]|nr:hypothetical protein [Pedosphaera sp.]
MKGLRIPTQLGNQWAEVNPGRIQVNDQQHRPLGHGQPGKFGGVVDGLHPITQILQPVHQLTARQKFLAENNGQRLRHETMVRRVALKCKKFSG